MAATVNKHFVDVLDGDHTYCKGDTFPREGVTVSDDRLAELTSLGLIKPEKKSTKK